MSLKWSQINFHLGFIQVEHSKNGKMRKFPMSSVLTETLKNVNKSKGEHVFMNNGKPIKYIQDAWESALKRAGIKNCRFHDLERLFLPPMRCLMELIWFPLESSSAIRTFG